MTTSLLVRSLLNRRYAPGTPDYARKQRLQNLGSTLTLGVSGRF